MTAASQGRVNAHTHLYGGLVPFHMPAPERAPTNFLEILERVWWRLDRAHDESTLRAAARAYVAEALLQGTTGLVDHHESPAFIEGSLDVLADACQELGMRAVLCYGATERNGGRDEARQGLAECRRFIRANQRPLVAGVVGIHAGFTVSDDTLREAGELARELDTVVHVHVAEDVADVRDARERGYEGPLERLLACDALPTGSILAHGVLLSSAEVRLCAERRFWLVQNPRSNHENGVGYPRALTHSRRVALGTDGFPADMIDEAEMLIMQAATHGEDVNRAVARLDAGHELLAERFGTSAAEAVVSLGHVEVGGRIVVEDGRLLTADLGAVLADANEQAALLWESMGALPE